MKIEKLSVYDEEPNEGVNNEYPTTNDAFKQPCLAMICGQRTAGKSHLTSKILAQAKRDKTFNRIYLISPSFNSNKAYFAEYIDESNVYEPTKTSILEVINEVERERDEFEQYLFDVEQYKEFTKMSRARLNIMNYNEDNMINYLDKGFFNGDKPKWKYDKVEPPKSLLILDDCLGSPAILQSSGLTRIATLSRHIAPLQENYKGRSACGLAVIILTQTYKMSQGLSRTLRENVSLLTLFKNKQQKQLDAIKDELANVVDIEYFDKAYEIATKEKYGNLTIDFAPKCVTKTFRKNLNEIIVFPELGECQCKKNKKP
jgi:hypothetical protein